MSFFLRFTFVVLFSTAHLLGLIDLEEFKSDFVVETKKIEVPGFPSAFNPSIVQWQGKLLMSFRVICELKPLSTGFLDGMHSRIGLVFLDSDFNAISEPKLLDLSFGKKNVMGREEDARLVTAGNHLYIVYSDNKEEEVYDSGFRVFVSELVFEKGQFTALPPNCFKEFEGQNPDRREKNWSPFEYEGKLHLIYTINPHIIFKPSENEGVCETVSKTKQELYWQWGDPRGGTPALKVDERRYLSFFHSLTNLASVHSQGEEIDHYFIGAYTFSSEPPFNLMSISSAPIIGNKFYHGEKYPYYWRPVTVVFPCGFFVDGNFLWVFYGREDHETWAMKIDKKKMLRNMVKCY